MIRLKLALRLNGTPWRFAPDMMVFLAALVFSAPLARAQTISPVPIQTQTPPMSLAAKQCETLHQESTASLAFPVCLKAANEGDVRGQMMLAQMYRDGSGTRMDKPLALDWMLRAAKMGHAPAMAELADWYLTGNGQAPDKVRALLWLDQAAKRGDVEAAARAAKLRR